MTNPKKPRKPCKTCGKETNLPVAIYCSVKCQREYEYRQYIDQWKKGEVSGGIIGECCSGHVRRYLLERDGERCSKCGWAEQHPITGKVPLQVHHINGDWEDNSEANVCMLCPNCHSLTETFGGLNRGRGRTWRYKKTDAPA